MITAFARQKWPKRHEHLVEECVAAGRVLHVSDVLPYLTGWHRDLIRSWNPPTHPHLTLVPRMGGPFRRWWFLCRTCLRRCETLYAMPNTRADDWRCRRCHGLIYAVQRYGFRHPLRRVLTRRKKRTAQKRIFPLERRVAKASARALRQFSPKWADSNNDELLALADQGRNLFEHQEAIRWQQAEALDRRLIAEQRRSLEVLRELAITARSKRARERAARSTARWERKLGLGRPTDHTAATAK